MRDRRSIRARVAPAEGTRPPAECPVDVTRSMLYTARELYDTAAYADSADARAYAWSRRPADRDSALDRALHDHAIDQALETWVRGRAVVGVMGGHALRRDDPAYAAAARLGLALGRALVVATGGGPGAMEAANLGARLALRPAGTLDHALAQLSGVASFTPSIDAWVGAAFEVLDEQSDDDATDNATLGIPTWHYGHEPPNAFATAIAKYFRNATREAILLEVCTAGIVFLPGAAGTVQEILQDACENYYAEPSAVAPMVLVGREHWTRDLPAWPLLQRLAAGRAMEHHLHLVDDLDEAAAIFHGSEGDPR